MEKVTKKAYAKINLALDVLGRRPDGYHELRMIMQTVDIYDTLTIVKTPELGIVLRTDSGELNKELASGKDNLICRAARELFAESGIDGGVEIFLEKRIPIAAGLAGGSADAAAALIGLNELFNIGYSLEKLEETGLKIGADIPYCIMGKTALAEGVGEILTRLPSPPPCKLVIAKPDINVSAAFAYKKLDRESADKENSVVHPDVDGMILAIREGSLDGITARLGNVLEKAVAAEYPVIEKLKVIMKEAGAANALMSGSGSAVFGIFTDEKQAMEAAAKIKERGLAGQVFVSSFV